MKTSNYLQILRLLHVYTTNGSAVNKHLIYHHEKEDVDINQCLCKKIYVVHTQKINPGL